MIGSLFVHRERWWPWQNTYKLEDWVRWVLRWLIKPILVLNERPHVGQTREESTKADVDELASSSGLAQLSLLFGSRSSAQDRDGWNIVIGRVTKGQPWLIDHDDDSWSTLIVCGMVKQNASSEVDSDMLPVSEVFVNVNVKTKHLPQVFWLMLHKLKNVMSTLRSVCTKVD